MRIVEVLTMINTKGEWIYTNAEIAYELGLSPATVNAIGKKLYGNKIPHWTALEVRRIIQYIKSISVEEDEKRLQVLHQPHGVFRVAVVADTRHESDSLNGVRCRLNQSHIHFIILLSGLYQHSVKQLLIQGLV